MTDYELSSVKKVIGTHFKKAAELSCYLREHPELPDQEFESSRKMVEILKEAGFEVTYPFAGYETAFHALFDNGDGPEVAILAEYDALPEIGHGCGHNLHGSLSVLTGLALKDLKEFYRGKVHVIGTPAEEENGAKIGMAAQGIFDNMSLAMMMHSWSGGQVPGRYGRAEPAMLFCRILRTGGSCGCRTVGGQKRSGGGQEVSGFD